MPRLLAIAFLAVGLTLARPARADGAFPAQLQVFLPAEQPNQIILITNFGLLRSDDGGATWLYLCEALAGQSTNIGLYQLGPDGTLLGDAYSGLIRTRDLGCSWSTAGGTLSGSYAWDAAFDPFVTGHVLALSPNGQGQTSAIYPSTDDAQTFGAPVYSMEGNITGIEFSQSNRGMLYVTGGEANSSDGSLGAPFVLVSSDGGQSFGQRQDHPELGDGILYLAGVDLIDSSTVYFRWVPGASGGAEQLLVTRDGGKTLSSIFTAPGPMSAFTELPGGALYAGTSTNGLWASAPLPDGGLSAFSEVGPVHVHCLGERAGTLYVCGDNWADHFALATAQAAPDGGLGYTPLLTFVQISGLASCPGGQAQSVCGPVWSNLESLFGIDGGTTPDAGQPTPPAPKGCGCASPAAGPGLALLGLLGLGLLFRRRRRA
ncbi:MAG: MYXO-CTERM sorting domain-containing protein [Deltaproteobacteria bacterium]